MKKNIDLYDENNKLIAQFLGLTIITDGISLFDTNYKPLCKYQESWNDLMPVVDKISKLDMIYYFSIMPNSSTDIMLKTIIIDDAFTFYYHTEEHRSTLDCLYMTVVSFIKWYNENKEEIK